MSACLLFIAPSLLCQLCLAEEDHRSRKRRRDTELQSSGARVPRLRRNAHPRSDIGILRAARPALKTPAAAAIRPSRMAPPSDTTL